MTYKDKLLHPKWQRKRLEILQRDNFTCTLCGDKETTLHIHHEEYNGEPWDIDNDKLKTVCAHCHEATHELKEFKIIKVIKEHFFDSINIMAFGIDTIFMLHIFCSSAIQLTCTVRYSTIELITKNIPTHE